MNVGHNENALLVGVLIAAGLLVVVSLLTMISRCYRRCGADEALVRTGSGGNKVIIGGGVLVFPVVHQLLRVSLRSVKLLVERSGKNALVTGDKIKANVTTELYIKVEPIAEDVLAAARSFGERNLDEHAIGELIEGKLTDALRSEALALADEEKAKQSIATVEITAQAERAKATQVIQAEADAARQQIAAEARAAASRKEAEATVILADAVLHKAATEAEARRKMVEAENTLGLKFVLRDVALRAIEVMPELARELMAPAQAIREIKVLQAGYGSGGAGSADGARPALGAMSPILKSILEAGAAYPLLRELMSFSGPDGEDLGAKVQGALEQLSGTLGGAVVREEQALRDGAGSAAAARAAGADGRVAGGSVNG